jgi:hypothetical protein
MRLVQDFDSMPPAAALVARGGPAIGRILDRRPPRALDYTENCRKV